MENYDLVGSVLFDIFYGGKIEELPGYETFKREVDEGGAKVSYLPDSGIILVHNDDSAVPLRILEMAHDWAHEIRVSHAYK